MATYSVPSGAVIRSYTRLQGQAFALADATLETNLATLAPQGEDRAFGRIGDGYETNSGLTARQVRLLQAAVSFRTGAVYLAELHVDLVGGTHEPLVVGSAEEVERLIARFEAMAKEYEDLLQGGAEAVDAKPFALPSADSGTFTYTSGTDRTPAERNAALDERDNLSAYDSDA